MFMSDLYLDFIMRFLRGGIASIPLCQSMFTLHSQGGPLHILSLCGRMSRFLGLHLNAYRADFDETLYCRYIGS